MKQQRGTGKRNAAVFWRLLKMYITLVFGISRLREFIQDKKAKGEPRRAAESGDGKNGGSRIDRTAGRDRDAGEETVDGDAGKDGGTGSETVDEADSKGTVASDAAAHRSDKISIVKTALLALFLIYIGGCFIVLFGTMAANLYKIFSPLGMRQQLFELEMLMVLLFLLMANFVLTLSTYSIGGVEDMLRAMPIHPAVLFGAKYLAHCIPAMLISLSFFLVTAAVYGFYEQQSFVFYAAAAIGGIFFPLPVIGFCYLVHILLMRTTAAFKNKQVIMLLGSCIGIALALGINYLVHWSHDTAALQTLLMQYQHGSAAQFAAVLPVRLFAKSLAASSTAERLGFLLIFIVLCSTLAAALVLVFSQMYVKTLDGFNEKKLKRLNTSERRKLFGGKLVQRPLWFSLLLREIRMMNREPAYLLNGPFMIIMFPLILTLMYVTGSADIPAAVSGLLEGGGGLLIAALCGAFLGSATNTAATAVSRDAKNISFMKSLPVPVAAYMQAKLTHAMLVALIGILIGTGGAAYFFSLRAAETAAAVSIALALAFFCNILALMLDTAHPKLHWDSPAAAIKHNINAIVIIFTDMLLVSIIAAAALFLSLPVYMYALYFAGVPFVLSCGILYFFFPYAERKISRLEL